MCEYKGCVVSQTKLKRSDRWLDGCHVESDILTSSDFVLALALTMIHKQTWKPCSSSVSARTCP